MGSSWVVVVEFDIAAKVAAAVDIEEAVVQEPSVVVVAAALAVIVQQKDPFASTADFVEEEQRMD